MWVIIYSSFQFTVCNMSSLSFGPINIDFCHPSSFWPIRDFHVTLFRKVKMVYYSRLPALATSVPQAVFLAKGQYWAIQSTLWSVCHKHSKSYFHSQHIVLYKLGFLFRDCLGNEHMLACIPLTRKYKQCTDTFRITLVECNCKQS